MEPLFYEVRPYLFLFAGLKAAAAPTASALMISSGVLLAVIASKLLYNRWAYRGYFGLSTVVTGRRSR